MEKYINSLKEKIDAADMILVGIGEEFGVSEKKIFEEDKYKTLAETVKENDNEWILPYFYAKAAKEKVDRKAYQSLAALLRGKNYFIVSLQTDDLLYEEEFGFQKDRIVTPCGGVRYFQCTENCQDKVSNVPTEIASALETAFSGGEKNIQPCKCPDCGKALIFNRIGTENYCEQGYMPEWERYTKWLQGTLNRNLCILELGVGMKYPNVIRWPFEKMAFFNQKACMFRVHSKLYQLTEELNGKGYGIAQHPIEFLANSFE